MFDVVKMITSNDRGKEIYNDYLERVDHGISVPERRVLVSIIAQALMSICGMFPTTLEKDSLAESLVATFPTLGIKEGEKLIYSHYFDSKSGGFIENALKRIRRGLPECRKRKRNQENRPHRKIPPGSIGHEEDEFNPEEIERFEFKVKLKAVNSMYYY